MRLCRGYIHNATQLYVLLTVNRPEHMKELFKLSKAKTLIWKELPYGDHNNTVAERGYFTYVDDFIKQYVVGGP